MPLEMNQLQKLDDYRWLVPRGTKPGMLTDALIYANERLLRDLLKDLSLEQGYQAARATGLNLLATARATLGNLDRVKRIVKVLGMVNSAPGFTDQPKVLNGFSDLMVEVFGEAIGKHARSAAGMAELPFNIPVEIEMILEVE